MSMAEPIRRIVGRLDSGSTGRPDDGDGGAGGRERGATGGATRKFRRQAQAVEVGFRRRTGHQQSVLARAGPMTDGVERCSPSSNDHETGWDGGLGHAET